MAVGTVRWRNIREFLDDLPREYCTSKPDHGFCTVCMRINYIVASNCPLFHIKPKRKRKVLPAFEGEHPEPIKEHLSADDVKHVLKGDDMPIIEFGGPRGKAQEEEEEVLDVVPLEVVPIETPKPISKAKKAEKRREVPTGPKEKTAPALTPGLDRDPERIVQEIMEELEFPDEVALAEGEGPREKVSDEKEPPEEPTEEDEEESDLDTDEGELDGEAKKGPPPVVVEKEAVRKRKPKSAKKD